ncbi:Aldo/keto reductase [Cerioporus squamosus]|nr:Aldo/keto reductase [Cerioporus squamosus]
MRTWRSQPGDVEKAVAHALNNGYSHIDTAAGYGNEKEVGDGIKQSGVPRSHIFLTTKLRNSSQRDVPGALDTSLKALDTPYLDLWLMHWPCPMKKEGGPDKEWDWRQTWRDMEKVKAIGVSNFSVKYLQELLEFATVIPAVNQIESHPLCLQEDIVEECRKHGIAVTAYSPLGSDQAPLLANPVVKNLAEKYQVTPANILISLQVNRPGMSVIPKSASPQRIDENAKIANLTKEDIEQLFILEKENHHRFCKPYWTGWGNIGFPDLE